MKPPPASSVSGDRPPRRSNRARRSCRRRWRSSRSPPSPIGRAIVLRRSSPLFCAGARLGVLGASTSSPPRQGKVVPTGRSKVIQPFETGVVRAIHVQRRRQRQGRRRADRARSDDRPGRGGASAGDLVAAELDVARLPGGARRRRRSRPPTSTRRPRPSAAQVATSARRSLLRNRRAARQARRRSTGRRRRRRPRLDTARRLVEKLERGSRCCSERVDMRKTLLAQGPESKINYLRKRRTWCERRRSSRSQKSREKEAEAALEAIDAAARASSPPSSGARCRTNSSRPRPRPPGSRRI